MSFEELGQARIRVMSKAIVLEHVQRVSLYGIARRNPLTTAALLSAGAAAFAIIRHGLNDN